MSSYFCSKSSADSHQKLAGRATELDSFYKKENYNMKKLPIYLHCWLVLCICTTLEMVSKILISIILLFDEIYFRKRKKVMMHLLYSPKKMSPKNLPLPKLQVKA